MQFYANIINDTQHFGVLPLINKQPPSEKVSPQSRLPWQRAGASDIGDVIAQWAACDWLSTAAV